MKYLANTLTNHILREASIPESTLKFVLPSYPATLLFKIGIDVREQLNRMVGRKVVFRYGIAKELGESWSRLSGIEYQAFQDICSEGWYNKTNNLTRLRNEVRTPDVDCLVILLAGYEHITDQASLRDFYHLDRTAVWRICLKKSFVSWVEAVFGSMFDLDDSKKEIQAIDSIFKALYEEGRADPLQISNFLESLDCSGVMSGRDAYHLVLDNLTWFKVPRMGSLIKYSGKKGFKRFLNAALDFYDYSAFRDIKDRDKALKKLEEFRADKRHPTPDSPELGEFDDLDEMLDTLQEYIQSNSEEARQRLLSADFIFLYEKILGYKPKKDIDDENGRKKIQRVTGLPPEVFLHAVWLTLGDYKKYVKSRNAVMKEEIKSIKVESILFKFDLGEDDDAQNTGARRFLQLVLGGIDDFITQRIDIKIDEERGNLDFESKLSPERNPELSFNKSGRTVPSLKFSVAITGDTLGTLQRQFEWVMPLNHPIRVLFNLYEWAYGEFSRSTRGEMLPAFAIPYMSEIFMGRDAEEVHRLVEIALGKSDCRVIDLLDAPGLDNMDLLKMPLVELSMRYQNFLRTFQEEGFFNALLKDFDNLRVAFTTAYERYLREGEISTLGPLLLKAFMLVNNQQATRDGWAWDSYLPNAIVTPLHPALMQMILYQSNFLCESFSIYVTEGLGRSTEVVFAERYWERVVDLARIQRPVNGTLRDGNHVLDTNVRSFEYLHLVGRASESVSFINSRLLLDYDEEDDDDITDAELFHETQCSRLISQVLRDFRKLHPYAEDGLSIGAYSGGEIQPIISGIDAYIKRFVNEETPRPYALNLTIFSDSKDDSSVMRWVNAWKHRWQQAALSTGMEHYTNCRVSISYRVVSRSNDAQHFRSLLSKTEFDVIFFTNFIDAGESRFQELRDFSLVEDNYATFPILEKVCCLLKGAGQDLKRERVLSNFRFQLSTLHSNVMARLKQGTLDPNKKYAVISKSDFSPWSKVIDVAHEHSTWVVCIDPSVDQQLLLTQNPDGALSREIIAFGSGVGSLGKNNYTISTQQFFLTDIEGRISTQISSLLNPLSHNDANAIAKSLIHETKHIAGLSLINATGPERYVREFIANAMVRKLLVRDENTFCDELISLDAFLHWFDDPEDERRPDLLRLKTKIVDGYCVIDAQIIECKLAQQSEGFVEKARQQVMSGLRQLVPRFRPRVEKERGFSGSPDQRYWWMQLHRLIASKGETAMPHYRKTLLALERLSEGYFSINWEAAIMAFWTDIDSSEFTSDQAYLFEIEGQKMHIYVAKAGRAFIRDACLNGTTAWIFRGDSKLVFNVPAVDPRYISEKETVMSEHQSSEDAVVTSIEVASQESLGQKTATETEGERERPSHVAVVSQLPERILLGSLLQGGRQVFWEFGHPELTNRHLLVFGSSGTGKTYTIQALLCELAKYGQNSLIVDYTNGFTNKQLEPQVIEKLRPTQHIVRKEPLPVNPFRQQREIIDDIELEEDPTTTAHRVSGVFSGVYRLGEQQKAVLYNAVREGIISYKSMNLTGLMRRLDEIRSEGGPVANSAATVMNKIQPLVDMHPFGPEDPEAWERLFTERESRCHIIQLMGFVKDSAQLITEFALFDLYWYYRSCGSKDNPKVIVLDEVQNLDHGDKSPLGTMLTEGRKFGISLILATQTLSNLNRDEQDRLFQASHKLFFKPADTELRRFAQILSDVSGEKPEEWVNRLASLQRGECYSLGPVLNSSTGSLVVNKPFKIRIQALEDRK